MVEFFSMWGGYGSIGYLLKVHLFMSRIKGELIGLDANKQYLQHLTNQNVYDHLVLASASASPFKDKTVDVSLSVEVIEHLDKKEGIKLLQELDRVTRKRAIITTPNGFHQVFGALNIYEMHRSGWTASELRKFGFKVRGIGVKLWWRKRNKLVLFLYHFLTPLCLYMPEIGAFLIAWKDFCDLLALKNKVLKRKLSNKP
jgi:ubiquinone/menaquinone biosynthesis C-methylase UbiE